MYGKDGVSKTETKNVNYESAYRCRICEKTFRKFIIFEGHFAFNAKCRAKNGWLHQCYICGEAFHHLALVKYHLRRHVNKNRTTNDQHKESLDVFNCNICQRKFITNFYLKNHMVLHSKKSITKKPQTNGDHRNGSSDEIVNSAKTSSFQCQICNIDCSDKTALEIHNTTHKHGGLNCERCKLSFTTEVSLKFHQNRLCVPPNKQNENSSSKHQCEVCRATFTFKYNLNRHMSCHTFGDVECKICVVRFTRQSLLLHVKDAHPELTYDDVFQNVSQKREINEQPDVSQNLSKEQIADKENSDLIQERPHECQICKTRFKHNYHLVRHEASHNGDFKCQKCQVPFTRRALAWHTSRFHPEIVGDTQRSESRKIVEETPIPQSSKRRKIEEDTQVSESRKIEEETQYPQSSKSSENVEKTQKSESCEIVEDTQRSKNRKIVEETTNPQSSKSSEIVEKTQVSESRKIVDTTLNHRSSKNRKIEDKTQVRESRKSSEIVEETQRSKNRKIVEETPNPQSSKSSKIEEDTRVSESRKIEEERQSPQKSESREIEEETEYLQRAKSKRRKIVEETQPFHECNVCKKKCSTASNLAQHIVVHTTGEYTCKICKFRFSKKSLYSHEKFCRRNNPIIKTPESSISEEPTSPIHSESLRQFSLQPTSPIHSESLRQYSCIICNATLNGRVNLKKHYKSHSFQCYVCKKEVPSVESLKIHIAKHIVFERWVDPVNVYLSNWSPDKSREILQNQPLVLVENLNIKGMNLSFSVSFDIPNDLGSRKVKNETNLTLNEIPSSIDEVKLENGTDVSPIRNGEILSAMDECEELSSCPINIEFKYLEQFDPIHGESNKDRPNANNEKVPIVDPQPDTTTVYADGNDDVIDLSSESDVDDMELFHCYFCDGTFRSLDSLGRHIKTCSFCP